MVECEWAAGTLMATTGLGSQLARRERAALWRLMWLVVLGRGPSLLGPIAGVVDDVSN